MNLHHSIIPLSKDFTELRITQRTNDFQIGRLETTCIHWLPATVIRSSDHFAVILYYFRQEEIKKQQLEADDDYEDEQMGTEDEVTAAEEDLKSPKIPEYSHLPPDPMDADKSEGKFNAIKVFYQWKIKTVFILTNFNWLSKSTSSLRLHPELRTT